MKIVEAHAIIESMPVQADLQHLEEIGRVCYKSEGKIAPGSYVPFLRKIIASGHESVIEHVSATVRFIVDRGVSHELVRHRLASYSQTSTRYCTHGSDNGEVTFINPCFWPSSMTAEEASRRDEWLRAMAHAEAHYLKLIAMGASPQEARSVLPNSLKTEIVMTANLREWRHVFRLRTSPKAHPQMLEIMIPLLAVFKRELEPIFDDFEVPTGGFTFVRR